MLKKSFYAEQDKLHQSQRAEARATASFTARQDQRTRTAGVPAASFKAPLKSQPKGSTGGYLKDPFKGLKG